MPYLKIQSNQPITDDVAQSLITQASQQVAAELGKPEKYVMVAIQPPSLMLFGGEDAPLAYLELKSIGLSEDQTAPLSRTLSDLVEKLLGIPADRIYIEFSAAPRKMWGWNGGTF